MAITRKFLDWSQPALPAVAEILIDDYAILGSVDLGNVVVVLPGSRAGRRLLELLVEQCDRRSLRLTPPQIETMGRLPELLYESKRPFAGELVQQLAWSHALKSVDRRRAEQVIPNLPDDNDVDRWLSLGRLLSSQHKELAGDGLDFRDVVEQGPNVSGFDEHDRWQILREIQEAYLHTLDALGLWDLQTARLFAIQHKECRTEKDIVLVGTVDMNRAMRQMLDLVADRVTAYIHAPQKLAKRFDEHGCLQPAAWQNIPLELDTQQVRVVDGPADQAEEVARAIADFDGNYRADEITIGVADESLVPQIQRQLTQCDVPSRWVIGKSVSETAPFQLLSAVGRYLDGRRFREFAALVRHPDMFAWIAEQGITIPQSDPDTDEPPSWLRELDNYHRSHMQPQLGQWLGREDTYAQIAAVVQCVEALLEPLSAGPQPLGDWTDPITTLLLNVYSHVEWDRDETDDRMMITAFETIHDALVEHTAVAESLAPLVTATEAIRLTLDQLAGQPIPSDKDPEAIELLGWLELPLDDAPALIVTSFNEGHVPKSLNADLFLPNRLRKHLQVDDNDRRYARDAYALSVLLASRADLTLIVGRRDGNDDPLPPSRLLFAADPDTIARRVLTFFQPDGKPNRPPLDGVLSAARAESEFTVPRPDPLDEPVDRLSVTAFRTYLACPYRFYLRHVLKLQTVEEDTHELDAMLFGNLLHDVLSFFGRSDVRDSADAGEIRDYLHRTLDRCVERMYGAEHVAAIEVQTMQMRLRLDGFADWQAQRAREGWRITHTEVSLSANALTLPVDDGRSIFLDGRIDRIDRFREENRWIIYDYKTGESAKHPDKTHVRGDEWVDLQLPLYRRIAEKLGVTGKVDLGYIVLSKDFDDVRHLIASWTESELNSADAKAVDVARSILNEEFWPPVETPSFPFSEFAAICQEGVFDREVLI